MSKRFSNLLITLLGLILVILMAYIFDQKKLPDRSVNSVSSPKASSQSDP